MRDLLRGTPDSDVKIVFDRDENKELVQTEQRQRDAAAAAASSSSSSSSQARVGPETRALAVAAAAAGVEAFGGDGGAGAVPPGVTLAAPTFVSAPGPTTVRKEVVIKVFSRALLPCHLCHRPLYNSFSPTPRPLPFLDVPPRPLTPLLYTLPLSPIALPLPLPAAPKRAYV